MTPNQQNHVGPLFGILATLYVVLFNAGLLSVTQFAGMPYWPGPWEPASVIDSYFRTHVAAVLTCLFLQFGATVSRSVLRIHSKPASVLRCTVGGPVHRVIRRLSDSLQRDRSEFRVTDDASTRNRQRTRRASGALLCLLCVWRPRVLGPDGAVYGRRLRTRSVRKVIAEVVNRARTYARRRRRIELVSSRKPDRSPSDSARSLSRIHMVDRSRLQSAPSSLPEANSIMNGWL
jgi:hypothetical protein